jgi:hypothetical protein
MTAAADLSQLASLRSNVSTTTGLAAILAEIARRGTYDSRPDSPNYGLNHFSQPLQPGEQLTTAYPGVVGIGSSYVPAVIRETSENNLYVDPYRMPRSPGLLGKLAGRQLDSIGLQQPMVFDRQQIQLEVNQPNLVQMSTPVGQVRGFPDAPLGRVTDLSAREQARHAWRLARGR